MSVAAREIRVVPEKPGLELVNEVQQFLYREVRLLDEQRFRDWQQLLTEDIFYWMPLSEQRYRRNERAPRPTDVAYYNDTMEEIELRIRRTEQETCWSEDPATRAVHVVSNIEVQLTEEPDQYRVYSVIQVYRNMNQDEEHTLNGRREDLLRRVDGELKLAYRYIQLAQNVFLNKSLNVFL